MSKNILDTSALNRILTDQTIELVRTQEQTNFTVRGWSMMPLLRNEKDTAVVKPITGELKIGDVVVFNYKDRYLLHRIIKIDKQNNKYIIKGDGVPFTTETVTRQDIIALMIRAIHQNGKTIECSSNEWIRKSNKWNNINPKIQYLILRIIRILEKLKLI